MRVLVLSPHRDDAAFSCGLVLHELVSAGHSISLVNVCTVSRYAPYAPHDGSDEIKVVTALRMQEDIRFVQMLLHATGAKGDQLMLLDLEWQDLPLRWGVSDEQSLAPLDLRQEEVRSLAGSFAALPFADLVLAPMALGRHLDHRLVAASASLTFDEARLVFYEDLPYACRMSSDEQRGSRLGSGELLQEAWLPIEPTNSARKQTYAMCYPSQIALDVADEMQTYAVKHGGRERFSAHPAALKKLHLALQSSGSAD